MSTYSDEPQHFIAPWEYVSFADKAAITAIVEDDATDNAVANLLETATKGYYKVDKRLKSPVAAIELGMEYTLEGRAVESCVGYKWSGNE